MKTQFINNSLIHSLGMCSGLLLFLAVFGTVHFRQDCINSAQHIRNVETQCAKLKNHEAEIMAYISQVEAPYSFAKGNVIPENVKDRVMRVHDWQNNKESFVTRNALAMIASRRNREIRF